MMIYIANIPDAIAFSSRGVVWKWEQRNGKLTKPLYIATDPTCHAKSNDPRTWRPFQTAVETVLAGRADGAGFVLGEGYAGIDLDDCRDPETGAIAPWAQTIIDRVDSYSEVSPSQSGIKIFVRIDPTVTRDGRTHRRPDGSQLELYLSLKYFTVTGDHLAGTPNTVEERTAAFLALYDELFPPRTPTRRRDATAATGSIDDFQLIEKAMTAADGATFRALWMGDCSGHAGDASRADLALCNLLAFWTDCDPSRMHGLFRRSGLMREKWDERRGTQTYGDRTIDKAIADCRETYHGPRRQEPDPVLSTPAETPELPVGIGLEDFYGYMPMHNYIFIPSRDPWPASSVNSRIKPIPVLTPKGDPVLDKKGHPKYVAASEWLDEHRPVEQMTWIPGEPLIIRDRLVSDGGWIDRPGLSCINLYRPPQLQHGDAQKATRWREHLAKIYPDDAAHIEHWLAHRVQHPEEKINHGLVLGGLPGIGKDTLLEPVKAAVGPWNWFEVTPTHLLGRFNGFAKSVVLRINEALDLGDIDRFRFYEHMKPYTAAPPDVLRIDEKNLREYAVWNVCGVIITTNRKDALYLPADDRRYYVAWSTKTKEEFSEAYWNGLYHWYADGGSGHVAAYLARLDLSAFNPKAPPPKTEAFWDIVNTGRTPEDAELADVLDELKNPIVVTLATIVDAARRNPTMQEFADWLRDRRNSRQIPHRLESAGYTSVRNPAAKDGLWRVDSRRMVIYAKPELPIGARLKAAQSLAEGK